LQKSGKVHCSGQRIVLILDTTSDLLESICKILVENWLHSQVFCANCIWQSERRELFARTFAWVWILRPKLLHERSRE